MCELSPQNGASDEADVKACQVIDAGGVSVSWLLIIACVHVMYVGFVLYGSKPLSPAVLASLTQNGRQWYLPERELPIYLLGCGLTLFFSLKSAALWRRTAVKRDLDDPGFSLRGCLIGLLLAVIGSGFNLSWILATRSVGMLLGLPRLVIGIVMTLPAVAEVLLFCLSQKLTAADQVRSLFRQNETEINGAVDRVCRTDSSGQHAESLSARPKTGRQHLIDLVIVIFICGVIYIPRTDLLAGSDYMFQHFHHWDFFAMGPAIGLLKGRHLATQVYCQYGFGWPLILAKLDPLFRLSYGHTYKIAVIYGCIYYCGLYWLLRRLLSNPAWAVAGLMLALRLQVFHGGELALPVWCIPSASILRTPCDIWVFLLLLAHWRSQRSGCLLMAGALVGLSLLFVIDTGVYLTLIFLAYNILWLASSKASVSAGKENMTAVDPASKNVRSGQQRLALSLAACIIGILILLAGMVAASGRAVSSPEYIRRWLEVLWLYPSGISMLPMVQETEGVILSYWLILLFLAHITVGAIRFRSGRLKTEDVIISCLAALGLLYLIYYIGNSHAYSILQLSTPLCIVAACAAERVTNLVRRGASGRFQPSSEQIVARAAAAGAAVVLLLNPQLRGYPSLFMSLFRPGPQEVVCFDTDSKDVCVAVVKRPNPEPFRQVVSEMRTISRAGKTVAVIANDDTAFYVASRSILWNRYTPLLPPLMTQAMLADVNRELSTKPVDFVFLKKSDPSKDGFWAGTLSPVTTDSWTMLSTTARRLYHFDHECGPYEVWTR